MLPARGAAAAAAGQAAGVVPLHQKPGTRTTTTITARARRRQQPQQQQQQQQQQSRSIITASGRRRTVCCALWGSSSSNDSSNNGGGDGDDGGVGPFNGVPPKRSRHAHNSGRRSAEAERRGRALLDYAMGVKPSAMDEFAASAPAAVVGAMRATCANMLGTLPPAYFEVRVLTEPQTLAHLFFSAAMTGWMFRNAALRLELRSALAGAALDASPPALPQAGAASASAAGPLGAPPSLQASQRGGQGPTGAAASAPSAAAAAGPTTPPAPAAAVAAAATAGAPPAAYWSPALHAQYAPGAQKHRVEGDVLLWHNERGVERLAAAGYMEALEGEVARLRAALAGAGAGTQGAGTGARAAAAAAAAALAFEGGGAGAGPFGPASVVAPAAAVGGGGEPAALQVFPPMPAGGGAAAGGAAGAGGGGGAAAPFAGGNPLLEYLRALDPASLKDLTAGIGDGAAAAVDAFVARMLGVASARDGDALRRCGPSECSAAELGRALFWLMVVGYTLRSLEMRLDMGGVSGAGGGGEAGGGGLRLSALLPGGGGGGGMPFARREGWKWPSL